MHLVLSHIFMAGSSCSIVLCPLGFKKKAGSKPSDGHRELTGQPQRQRDERETDRDDDGELLLVAGGH